jgi:hypothetical protein
MDFVIKQNSELPILEIRPIKTKFFDELLVIIKDASISFSMYDQDNCPTIINKDAIINLSTPLNNYNNKNDSCVDLKDFTIQYHFTKKDTAKSGIYSGEFKIKFNKDGEEKNLTLLKNINIEIIKSNTKNLSAKKIIEPILFEFILIGNNEYISTNDNFYLKLI